MTDDLFFLLWEYCAFLSLVDLRFLVIWRLAHDIRMGNQIFSFPKSFARDNCVQKSCEEIVPVETFLSSIFLQSIIAHVDYTNVISQFWNVLFIGGSDKTLVYSLTSSLTS